MSPKKMNPDALVLLKMQLIFAIRSVEDKIYHENPFDGKMNFTNCKCLQFKEVYNLIKKANKGLEEHNEEKIPIKPINNSLTYPEQNLKEGIWKSFVLCNEFEPRVISELTCSIGSNANSFILEQRILRWQLLPEDIVLIWDENIANWKIANHKTNPWKKSACTCPLMHCETWSRIQQAYFQENKDYLEQIILNI